VAPKGPAPGHCSGTAGARPPARPVGARPMSGGARPGAPTPTRRHKKRDGGGPPAAAAHTQNGRGQGPCGRPRAPRRCRPRTGHAPRRGRAGSYTKARSTRNKGKKGNRRESGGGSRAGGGGGRARQGAGGRRGGGRAPPPPGAAGRGGGGGARPSERTAPPGTLPRATTHWRRRDGRPRCRTPVGRAWSVLPRSPPRAAGPSRRDPRDLRRVVLASVLGLVPRLREAHCASRPIWADPSKKYKREYSFKNSERTPHLDRIYPSIFH